MMRSVVCVRVKSMVASTISTVTVAVVLAVLALTGSVTGLTKGLGAQPLSGRGQHTERSQIHQPQRKSEYRNYRFAGVTTDTNICSKIGVKILAVHGGSAVDAAIASMLCVGVVNLQSTGIGGGHFATIYDTPRNGSEKVLVTLLSRERAPHLANREMFVYTTHASTLGGLAIAVPGQISGFYAAWERFGRVPWADIVQPTIEICEQGFKVEASLSYFVSLKENIIRSETYLSELLVKADGSLVTEGDILVDQKLATTLRRIAADPKGFYSGSLADDIVADIKERGGIISSEDLQKYKSRWKAPQKVVLSNGNYTLYNPPPPSMGVVVNFIARILDGYNFKPSDLSKEKTLVYHRMIEAFKFADAKRSELGDPDFGNITAPLERLTSLEYANEIRRKIDDKRTHDFNYYEPTFDIVQDHGTSHVNVMGPDGSAVAMTSTIHLYFGSTVRGRRTGIIFNDVMGDFGNPGIVNIYGKPQSPSNYVEPGKMPMSAMSPTLVFDSNGKVILAIGASGGPKIFTSVAFVLLQSLWFDFDLRTATDMPRVHHQLVPDYLYYERGLDPGVYKGLRAKHHSTLQIPFTSTIGAIRNRCRSIGEGLCIEAVSDGRKGGAPDGY